MGGRGGTLSSDNGPEQQQQQQQEQPQQRTSDNDAVDDMLKTGETIDIPFSFTNFNKGCLIKFLQ